LTGLQHLHKGQWGHGDVRWANVMCEERGRYRLIDLESAQKLNEKTKGFDAKAWGHQKEALEDGKFTAKSDLYMVGRMLKELNEPSVLDTVGEEFREALLSHSLTVEQALGHPWLT
jgi:hypothetical protein